MKSGLIWTMYIWALFQLLHNSGGWPLNCFALPDGRPFWGGTYFRPDQWVSLLEQISGLFRNSRHELEEQAERLIRGIGEMNLISVPAEMQAISVSMVEESMRSCHGVLILNWWLARFTQVPDAGCLAVCIAASKMTGNPGSPGPIENNAAWDGLRRLFDRIGGGFARYSTDAEWKVPHFEKMLYDNAQLITLWSICSGIPESGFSIEIAEQSIEFVLPWSCKSGRACSFGF
ncbi:MAG: thioredoxin domain-containing protein [Bacteroidales bacterium]|nr:thioredoxin domain-containing protein [Bacteroidales bacterium]